MAAQMDTEPRAHKEYTVGWVCALPKEQTAATAMLDRRHVGLSKPPNDPNTYTLGCVGNHNVVIACLPKGQIGNNSAANVAAWMISTFPSIRFGLMVGIGGGVPPKVRLGDVVVSTPMGQFPGLVQWDFGKAKEGGSFERTGSLNNPPTSLLTALTALETEHDLVGSKIPEYLEGLRKKWPRLVPKYLPFDLQDILFKADYEHASRRALDPDDTSDVDNIDDDDEESCRFCDKTQIVRRKTRDMAVHFDLGGHVLCIEMEAAGLINNFPCIVIRGICDYADSHKNKDWQEYAAAIAAAFAKEFLEFLQPTDVEGERPVKEILGRVLDTVSQTRANVKKMSSYLEKEEDLKMLNSITPINYSPQQSDFLGRRQHGTGQWLLDSTQFNKWKATKNQTMFCPGMPGAGKTIISSIVVDHLDQEFQANSTVGLAYIYYNFKRQDDQMINNLLASLLKQLAKRCVALPDSIKELYWYHKAKQTRPSADEISKCLHIVAATFSKLFIIVDALDECQASSRLPFISELFNLQTRHSANIFATSRFIPEIIDQFKDSISLEIRATDEDVRIYLESHMGQLRPYVLENCQLQEEIKTSISDAVDGMFLLAQIYLSFLDDKLTINDIRGSLKSFRKQDRGSSEDHKTEMLSHAYDQVMERIDQQRPGLKQLALKVLSWITCAKRPLSITELQYALAIKEGKFQLDEGNLPHIRDMVSVCLGLITIDDESSIIRLVHYTTQEYFARTREDWVSNAHTEIAKSCVTCLSFDVFEAGYCSTIYDLDERLSSTVLYGYAVENWGYHARCSLIEDDKLILDLLQNTSKVSACSQAMVYIRDWDYFEPERFETKMTGLHLAAYFGLRTSTSNMLEQNADAEASDVNSQTPLSWAADHGHYTVVKLLLERNAVVETSDINGQTPLSLAAENGHDIVVKLLLERNAIVDSQDEFGRTPLSRAAKNGHDTVVKLLLERNAVVDSQDEDSRTPLSRAAKNGHDMVVKLLLERNAVDFQDKDGRTPLSRAAENGHDIVVKLLLERNIVVDSQDKDGRTPLSWAAEHGHDIVVKLLLERNAIVDSQDEFGRTPLSRAAKNGHDIVVKLLLERNAIVDSRDEFGRTPLSRAVKNGRDIVVKLLLERNAVVDSQDEEGQTPLSQAAENGYDIVVKLLLKRNAVVNSQDKLGRTPLSRATKNGHNIVVVLLLAQNTDIESRDTKNGQAPLLWAAENGHGAVVKLLLEKKTEIESSDSE
ncbi:uncharacterized protein N7482_003020 [Penicillium canariense]|uniref:Nucleoside phosphorylase domain-containing protein n=1 Tax=Penicillium canariense TaxID=189055 RepID=A0A9W9IG97_9EURO|nr:uncharacterized protein N7482_003020 [Penicillium canariense]KAJ5177143.1 hypothetical protein N7482_003020 [Penicillium canariense]